MKGKLSAIASTNQIKTQKSKIDWESIDSDNLLYHLVFIAVGAIVILTFFQGFVKEDIGLSNIRLPYTGITIEIELLDEMIIALLTFLLLIIILSMLREISLSLFPYLGLFGLISAHFIISAFINSRPIIIGIISLRDVFQYLPFFWILLFFFDLEEYNKIFKLIIALLLIQIPFVLYQYLTAPGMVDLYGGTMGHSGSHILSLSMGIGAIYFLAKWIRSGEIHYILGVILIGVVILLASYRTMILLFPLLIVLSFSKLFQLGRKRSIFIAAILVLLIVSIENVLNLFGISYTLKLEALIHQQSSRKAGRFLLLSYTQNLILRNRYTFLWGIGPGYYVSKTARNLVDSPYSRGLGSIINPSQKASMQYPITLGETGVIGLGLIIGLFIWIFYKIYRDYNKVEDEYKPILLTTLMAMVLYLGSGVSGNIFEWQVPSLILWFLIAYSHRILWQKGQADEELE